MHNEPLLTRARSASDCEAEVRWIHHAVRAGQHLAKAQAERRARPLRRRAASAGAHTQAEAVRLGTTTVVRLISPLGGH